MHLRSFCLAAATASLFTAAALADCSPQDPNCPKPNATRHETSRDSRNDAMRGDQQNSKGAPHDAMQSSGQDSRQGPAAMKAEGHMDGARSGFQGGPQNGGSDWQWKDERGSVHKDHDRYWRQDYHGQADKDRILREAKRRGYGRFDGEPMWSNGRFVVKSFDRKGQPVFLEFNPYTASFIGIVRF